MKTIDILELWKEDSKLDQFQLDKESLSIPMKHAKYYQILAGEQIVFKKLQRKLNELQKERWEFYAGKNTVESPQDQYRQKIQSKKILKNDIPLYMDSDVELNDMRERVFNQEVKVQLLKDILKSLGERNWTIRNAIDWRKFSEGG